MQCRFERNKLTLEELKVFNFVSLSCNMNGRVVPLLDLTWDQVERIKKHGNITEHKHKTGHYYDQEIKIHQEQFPWLKRLRKEFKKKHGYRSELVFGFLLDTKDHSLAATIRKVLGNILMKNFRRKVTTEPPSAKCGNYICTTMPTKFPPKGVRFMQSSLCIDRL